MRLTDLLIIFGAKYLFLAVPGLALGCFLRQPAPARKRLLLSGMIALPLAYLIAKIAGHFFYLPRPFMAGGFVPLVPHAAENGFPSEHTLLCAAISAVMYPYDKISGTMMWALTALVGASRVLAGVHHTADIVGAIAASLTAVWIMRRALARTAGVGPVISDGHVSTH